VKRIFLLSPAHCGGERARLLLNERPQFDLAQRVHGDGAPLGEVFSFMSGLYFRGKLAYAQAFASPPRRVQGVLVITSSDGLRPADETIDVERLRRFATVDIGAGDSPFRDTLARDACAVAKVTGDDCESSCSAASRPRNTSRRCWRRSGRGCAFPRRSSVGAT